MIHTPPGAWPEPGPEYLASARFIDSGTELVRRFAVPEMTASPSPGKRKLRLISIWI